MAKRDIGQEILDGICEIKAHKAGQLSLKTRARCKRLPQPKKFVDN